MPKQELLAAEIANASDRARLIFNGSAIMTSSLVASHAPRGDKGSASRMVVSTFPGNLAD